MGMKEGEQEDSKRMNGTQEHQGENGGERKMKINAEWEKELREGDGRGAEGGVERG